MRQRFADAVHAKCCQAESAESYAPLEKRVRLRAQTYPNSDATERQNAPPLRPRPPRDRVAQQGEECVAFPRPAKRQRRGIRRIDDARRPDRGVVTVAQRKVRDTPLAHRARVAEHARLAVRLQRRVRWIERADRGRRGGGAVVRGRTIRVDRGSWSSMKYGSSSTTNDGPSPRVRLVSPVTSTRILQIGGWVRK